MLVVDKPAGLSSHDMVGRARRALGTKRVGHAGTLDPMATGVLVLLVGEATKLGAYLTAHRKSYLARVAFGMATATLDAEGAPTEEVEPPAWLRAEIAALVGAAEGGGADAPRLLAALGDERQRRAQVPPAFSAIQVGGVRSYARARAGEEVELPERAVEVSGLVVTGGDPGGALPALDLAVGVSKGYYVRALARDLGARLGVPAHLAALRRTASGPFTLASALPLSSPPGALRAALLPLAEAAARSLPLGSLSPAGVPRARAGKRLAVEDFLSLPPEGAPAAWLDEEGRLVAIGVWRDADDGAGQVGVVLRGFMGGADTGQGAPRPTDAGAAGSSGWDGE